MPYYYITSNRKVQLTNDGSSFFTAEKLMEASFSSTPAHASEDHTYFAYGTEEQAKKVARTLFTDEDAAIGEAVLVFQAKLSDDAEITETPIEGKFIVKANQVTLEKIILNHINSEWTDISLIPSNSAQDFSSSSNNSDNSDSNLSGTVAGPDETKTAAAVAAGLPKAAGSRFAWSKLILPLVGTSGAAVALWFGGALPQVLPWIAKAGLSLPTVGVAAVASNVAVTIALATVVTASAWLSLKLVEIFATASVNAYKEWSKTRKQRNEDELAKDRAALLDIEKGNDINPDLLKRVNQIIDDAPEIKYAGQNLANANEQPVLARNEVTKKALTMLRTIVAANDSSAKKEAEEKAREVLDNMESKIKAKL